MRCLTVITIMAAKLPGNCDFAITYGQTEATIAQWTVPADFRTNNPTLPVGYLSPEFEYAIVDEEQRPVNSGEMGELLVRGRCVALGEWERGQCVAGRTRPDNADPESRILPTGDLVRLRPDHLLEVVGRVDRQIKIHGLRVEPAEVENVIRRVPGVTDAAIAVRRAEHDAMLLAFVVGNMAADPELLNRVRRATRSGLPFHMQPTRIRIVERLPTLAGSKIDTQALLELDATAPQAEQVTGIRQSDLAEEASQRSRQAVKRAWIRTLGRPSFKTNMTFEAAGGDSLTFLSLIFAIERQLCATLPLDAFHSQLRPDEFARCVDDCLNGARNGASPRDGAPVFLFPGGGGDELNLVRFRARCAPAVRVQLLEYGAWQNWLAPGVSLDDLISDVVRQTELRAPEGPISLAGHSLGGHLAYATALELFRAGRTVDFLGILDSEAGMTPSVAFYSNPRADILSRVCSHLPGGDSIDKAVRALCQRTRRAGVRLLVRRRVLVRIAAPLRQPFRCQGI